MEIIGKQIEFGLGVESVRGTAETTAQKWAKKVEANIMPRVHKVDDDSTQGVLEDSIQSRVVRKWYDGELSGIVHADLIGYLFYQMYGDVTSTNVTGSVTTHEFAVLQNIEHPTLSGFVKDGGVSQAVLNEGVVDTLELNATTDDFVRFTTNLIFSTDASNSDTPSYDTEYDFIGKDITVKVADSEAGLSGASALKVKELTLNWSTGALSDFKFGSYNPENYNTQMAIEGSMVLNYTDDTFKDLFESDDTKYLQISITGDPVLAGSNTPEIVVTLNKIQVKGWERSGGRDEIVTQEVSFKAFYNETDSKMSTVEITNLTTDYEITS